MSDVTLKCVLCLNPFKINQTIIIGKCNHVTCSECLVKYVTANLQATIECPIDGCQQNISDPTIRKCLSNDQTILYDSLSIAGIAPPAKARKCPIKECPFIYIYNDFSGTFTCPYCDSSICVECNDIHLPKDCNYEITDSEKLHNEAIKKIKEKRSLEVDVIDRTNDLCPNPNGFHCEVCTDFIMPRCGVILRNCLHSICRDCLKEMLHNISSVDQIQCHECSETLHRNEFTALIDEEKFAEMMKQEATSRFFTCKSESCRGMWEVTKVPDTMSVKCHLCELTNCLACEDIHEGMSCEQFRKAKRYINSQGGANILSKNKQIECFVCKTILIPKVGCGDIHCDGCGNNTCIFTGKIAGRHNPEKCYCNGSSECSKKDHYCECTASKPCNEGCIYGCFSE